MTALAADINVLTRDDVIDVKTYKVADNVKIYKGAMVSVDNAGYARPARATATDRVVGIAEQGFDNTISGHAAGGRDALGQWGVKVKSGVHALLLCVATVAQASVGVQFYALDDQTATATAGTSPALGRVSEFVDATHAWIFIPAAGVGVTG